jgi:2'-5' RNA ligase
MMLRKFYTSAIVLIPPQSLWPPIQEIRRVYDRAYVRWMPHINLIYPFVHNDAFPQILPKLSQALAPLQPFTISLERFKFFPHTTNYTMWLEPKPNSEVIKLHNILVKTFPEFDDLDTINERGFTPHLSVGQQKDYKELLEKIDELQKKWQPLQWNVGEVYLISRFEKNPHEVRYIVPFGGSAPVAVNVMEFSPKRQLKTNKEVIVANLPYGVTEEMVKALFSEKELSVTNVTIAQSDPREYSKNYCFVEFKTEEEKRKAIEWDEKITWEGRVLRIRPKI